jgi:hypothetical protein
MPNFTKKFGMTFAKKGTYGVPEIAGTEVNRRSGNLKGLSGVPASISKFKKTQLRPAYPAGISTTRWSEPNPHLNKKSTSPASPSPHLT